MHAHVESGEVSFETCTNCMATLSRLPDKTGTGRSQAPLQGVPDDIYKTSQVLVALKSEEAREQKQALGVDQEGTIMFTVDEIGDHLRQEKLNLAYEFVFFLLQRYQGILTSSGARSTTHSHTSR